MEKMKYVSIPRKNIAQVKRMDIPVPKEGEALIRILYGGICGSDMRTYQGTFMYSSFPRIPGHEFSAQIVSAPENACGLSPGMIVTGNPYYNCKVCYSCRRDLANCCVNNQTLGAQRDGIFREYFAIPVDRLYDGNGLDAKLLALVEPFCISYHAAERGRVTKGDRVLVIGAGPIGIFAAIAAKNAGAEVTVCDISPFRLSIAREMGADHTIISGKEDIQARTKEITGEDGFDVCLECAGQSATFLQCIEAAAFRGRVVVVGIGRPLEQFAYAGIQTKELDIHGSRNAHRDDFPKVIDIIKKGGLGLEKLITDVYPLDEAPKAFAGLDTNPEGKMKVLIDFA